MIMYRSCEARDTFKINNEHNNRQKKDIVNTELVGCNLNLFIIWDLIQSLISTCFCGIKISLPNNRVTFSSV